MILSIELIDGARRVSGESIAPWRASIKPIDRETEAKVLPQKKSLAAEAAKIETEEAGWEKH